MFGDRCVINSGALLCSCCIPCLSVCVRFMAFASTAACISVALLREVYDSDFFTLTT